MTIITNTTTMQRSKSQHPQRPTEGRVSFINYSYSQGQASKAPRLVASEHI